MFYANSAIHSQDENHEEKACKVGNVLPMSGRRPRLDERILRRLSKTSCFAFHFMYTSLFLFVFFIFLIDFFPDVKFFAMLYLLTKKKFQCMASTDLRQNWRKIAFKQVTEAYKSPNSHPLPFSINKYI